MPLMNPSTTERATSSRFPTRARTTGSTNRAPVNPPAWISLRILLHARARHRDGFEQAIDQRVAGDAFRLRVKIREHSVAQDRMRQRADILEADVITAAGERAGLAPEHQVLRGADACAERRPLLDWIGCRGRFRPARPHQ